MYSSENTESSTLQTIASAVGLLLPLTQMLLQFFPDKTKDIFLFTDFFFFVSVFATIFSYTLILIVRGFPNFEIPVNIAQKSKYEEHLTRQNQLLFKPEEIKEYLRVTPYVRRPFHFNSNNIFIIFLPAALLSFTILLLTGFIKAEDNNINILLKVIQIISYILLIASSTLTLAIYHIKESNRKKYSEQKKATTKNAIRLAYEANAFSELPHISLVAQSQQLLGGELVYNFIFNVDSSFYILQTDWEVNQIKSIQRYNNFEDLVSSLTDNNL
jgi:heme/copper-type cytochrome/quinol oxidase subunit 3